MTWLSINILYALQRSTLAMARNPKNDLHFPALWLLKTIT